MKPGETTHSDYQLSDGGRVEVMLGLAPRNAQGRMLVLMSLLHDGRLVFDRELLGSVGDDDPERAEFWPELFGIAREHVACLERPDEVRPADQLAWSRWFGPHLLEAEAIGSWTENRPDQAASRH